jgi:inosine-uridine nucleoside N-ribohydrolase
MKQTLTLIAGCITGLLMAGCSGSSSPEQSESSGIPVIFDTDSNNELDDQHALAYLLLNRETFDVAGVTVNATWGGGDVESHYDEAVRIVQLCNQQGIIPVYKGANGSYPEIKPTIGSPVFDGADAVNFMIEESLKKRDSPLVILAVGKLTNVALALEKDPAMADRIRLVWLGSNYPAPGEYNQDNDTAAMNYLLNTDVPFEMVTVRGGKPSGTAAVTVSRQEINTRMPGLGPVAQQPVTGRHGGSFSCFGDYSVSLFEHIDYHDDAQTRALFDMAAVAIVKEPDWASSSWIPAPLLVENSWAERPSNSRQILVWENFRKAEILQDFFTTLEEAAKR